VGLKILAGEAMAGAAAREPRRMREDFMVKVVWESDRKSFEDSWKISCNPMKERVNLGGGEHYCADMEKRKFFKLVTIKAVPDAGTTDCELGYW
jgi:hypothetical protein